MSDPASPAVHVSWEDAKAYITFLNHFTDEIFRLPTEAEWEYACRAGSTTEYSFGESSETLSDNAWWVANSGGVGETYAHVVGQLMPNAFGLFDMHGNVIEFCEDFYDADYYSISPSLDPRGPASGSTRIWRGGAVNTGAGNCRSAFREELDPTFSSSFGGFRLVR